MKPMNNAEFFAKVIENTFVKLTDNPDAEITPEHILRFNVLGKWLAGERKRGWFFMGNTGSGKTVLLETINDILRNESYVWYQVAEKIVEQFDGDRMENMNKYRTLFCSVESKTIFTPSHDICRLANLKGLQALLYDEKSPGNVPVLIVDDLGNKAEIDNVSHYDKESRNIEQITPIYSLLQHRFDNNIGITFIATNLNLEGIIKRYDDRIEDRISNNCIIGKWEFESYRKKMSKNLIDSQTARHLTKYTPILSDNFYLTASEERFATGDFSAHEGETKEEREARLRAKGYR